MRVIVWLEVLITQIVRIRMVAEGGAQIPKANGVAEGHQVNGGLENGDLEHVNAGKKLTAAEKKKLKKKQRKANKQAER